MEGWAVEGGWLYERGVSAERRRLEVRLDEVLGEEIERKVVSNLKNTGWA